MAEFTYNPNTVAVHQCRGSVLSQDPLATADLSMNQGCLSSPQAACGNYKFEVSLGPFLQAEGDGRLAAHQAERWAKCTV